MVILRFLGEKNAIFSLNLVNLVIILSRREREREEGEKKRIERRKEEIH